MTKIFGVFVAAMMMLGVASSASAWWMPSNDIKIENEHTSVTTVAKADVNTGGVTQMGGWFTTAKTGDIYGVSAVGLSQVNMTNFGGCACSHMGDVKVENEGTHVTTIAKADVDTGKVSQFSWGGMKMGTTGSVTYVSTDATSVVNYTDFSVSTPTDPSN
jgi:uncharacterized membrane protein YeiB